MTDHDHGQTSPIHNPHERLKDLEKDLVGHHVLEEGAVDAFLADQSGPGVAQGASIIARAWKDALFKRQLLEDAGTCLRDAGWPMPDETQPLQLRVVENTPRRHNVIVCTLCSCYPRWLLGPPPDWYVSDAYRAKVVRDPRGTLEDFGVVLPASKQVSVWDSTAETRYLVLPEAPPDAASASEDDLAARITERGMIGTALQ